MKRTLKAIFFSITINLALSIHIFSQVDSYNTLDLHPVSPSVYQFFKYTEMPVNEYTGLADITIPIYSIDVDGLKIPLKLTYHSQGIRTSEEASWVGLGWDMTFSSIVQIVNDRDDFGDDSYSPTGKVIRMQPDFYQSGGMPFDLPYKFDNCNGIHIGPSPVINQPVIAHGFGIVHEYQVPMNGQCDVKRVELFNDKWVDTEPDIFIANLFGEIIKFSYDFKNDKLVILNKNGYDVFRTLNGYKIKNPSGHTFYFELKKATENVSYSNDIYNNGYTGFSGSTSWEAITNTFYLTKIVTKNSKEITFNYVETQLQECYPNYSEKFQSATSISSLLHQDVFENCDISAGNGGPMITYFPSDLSYVQSNLTPGTLSTSPLIAQTYSLSREQYVYPQSITYPYGQVNFITADRDDIIGGKKLSSIQLYNTNNEQVSNWDLHYSYFQTPVQNGNGYTYGNGQSLSTEQRSSLRLKLLEVVSTDGGKYSFNYNSASLPLKNTFAQDYWGFYNGQFSNNNLIPHPTGSNSSLIPNIAGNRDANLNYTKAGILEKITYPTGGNINFEYELNEFNSDAMIGLKNTSTIVQGCGLRIKKINVFDNITNLYQSTEYTYFSGKLVEPIMLSRLFNITDYQFVSDGFFSSNTGGFSPSHFNSTQYSIFELGANGVFSTNPLSSIKGVGYSIVKKKKLSNNNNTNGIVETEFFNASAVAPNFSVATFVKNCNIPSYKSSTEPENGSVKSEKIYDNSNNLLKEIQNDYGILTSTVLYGARCFNGYKKENYCLTDMFPQSSQYEHLMTVDDQLIGFYPIFDINTQLGATTTKIYDHNGKVLTTKKNYVYDGFDQLQSEQLWDYTGDGGWIQTEYTHPYYSLSIPGSNELFINHRYSEVTKIRRTKYPYNYYPNKDLEIITKEFKVVGNNIVLDKVIENSNPVASPNNPQITYFKEYDNNGNITNFISKDGINTVVIYGYNHQYPVAKIVGSDYATVSNLITSTMQHNLDNASANVTSDVLVRQVFNTLRAALPSALISCYTYAPLIGITSETDPQGKTIYYEYDNFNRLKLIRDKDNNILKTFEYKYQEAQ